MNTFKKLLSFGLLVAVTQEGVFAMKGKRGRDNFDQLTSAQVARL